MAFDPEDSTAQFFDRVDQLLDDGSVMGRLARAGNGQILGASVAGVGLFAVSAVALGAALPLMAVAAVVGSAVVGGGAIVAKERHRDSVMKKVTQEAEDGTLAGWAEAERLGIVSSGPSNPVFETVLRDTRLHASVGRSDLAGQFPGHARTTQNPAYSAGDTNIENSNSVSVVLYRDESLTVTRSFPSGTFVPGITDPMVAPDSADVEIWVHSGDEDAYLLRPVTNIIEGAEHIVMPLAQVAAMRERQARQDAAVTSVSKPSGGFR